MLATLGICYVPRDPIAAQFNGGCIRRSELVTAMENDFGAEVLQELITQRIITKAIADSHLAISDAELALWADDYQLRPEVQEIIAAGQLDTERLREHLRTTVPLYYLAIKDVSETEREKFFAEHRSLFEQLDMSHILLGSEAEALRIRQRINSPESFSTMAIVHSLDDSNRDFSGALGRVTRAELENAFSSEDVQSLFKMQPGTVSRPMQAKSGGWHLFLVKKRFTNYTDLQRQVVAYLAEPKLADCLERLRSQAQVKILWQAPNKLLSPSPSPSSAAAKASPSLPGSSAAASPAAPPSTAAPATVNLPSKAAAPKAMAVPSAPASLSPAEVLSPTAGTDSASAPPPTAAPSAAASPNTAAPNAAY